MTRQDMLRRIKRQIQLGIYEDDDKWIIALSRIAADLKTDDQRCRSHVMANKPASSHHTRPLTAES